MNLNEFTREAVKTESLIDYVEVDIETLTLALMAYQSSSVILDAIKKNTFYGKPVDQDEIDRCSAIIKVSGECLQKVEPEKVVVDINPRIFHALIGIMTESGELSELLVKTMENAGELDEVNMLEEFGDISWYKAIAFDETSTDPERVLDAVINKLRDRYPNKFKSDDAINRDLNKERNTLEGYLGE